MTGEIRPSGALVVERLVAGYIPEVQIVQDVSLTCEPGEILAVLGPNGAGKSTLVKSLVGLARVEAGRVRLGKADLTGLATHRIVAAGIGFVPQLANVFATLTIHDNLLAGHFAGRGETSLQRIYGLFPDLERKRRNLAGSLSGGQRQLLAISRALVAGPSLLILDEPSAGLSPIMVQEVFGQIVAVARSGIGILLVEQNVKAALRIADRGLVLVAGRIAVQAGASELQAQDLGRVFLAGAEPA